MILRFCHPSLGLRRETQQDRQIVDLPIGAEAIVRPHRGKEAAYPGPRRMQLAAKTVEEPSPPRSGRRHCLTFSDGAIETSYQVEIGWMSICRSFGPDTPQCDVVMLPGSSRLSDDRLLEILNLLGRRFSHISSACPVVIEATPSGRRGRLLASAKDVPDETDGEEQVAWEPGPGGLLQSASLPLTERSPGAPGDLVIASHFTIHAETGGLTIDIRDHGVSSRQGVAVFAGGAAEAPAIIEWIEDHALGGVRSELAHQVVRAHCRLEPDEAIVVVTASRNRHRGLDASVLAARGLAMHDNPDDADMMLDGGALPAGLWLLSGIRFSWTTDYHGETDGEIHFDHRPATREDLDRLGVGDDDVAECACEDEVSDYGQLAPAAAVDAIIAASHAAHAAKAVA